MNRILFGIWALMGGLALQAQERTLRLRVTDAQQRPLAHATVEWLKGTDSSLLKVQLTDTLGGAEFAYAGADPYFFRVSCVGFAPYATPLLTPAAPPVTLDIRLEAAAANLDHVTISARRPFIELRPDKTVVNLESSLSNAGTTALEALEKMPGITVDRDGNISLKGRSGVLVLIDGRQTYVGAAELATLLGGMNAASISQVEIMTQSSARYDAAGNAGVINIRTKKNRQRGFNGSVTSTLGQGFYPKNNNSLQLNYQHGRFNTFLNYGLNAIQGFTRIYALRTYFKENGDIAALLEQPTFLRSRGTIHNLRTGIDFTVNARTSLGLSLNGLRLSRNGSGRNPVFWMNADRVPDSLIRTDSRNTSNWQSGGLNLNLRHTFSAGRALTADIDALGYRIRGTQYFENEVVSAAPYTEASRAQVPSDIRIYSAKAHYAEQRKAVKWEGGWKSSLISTDNLAAFQLREGTDWKEDLGRTNHFRYHEQIHALYSQAQATAGKWTLQGGLRYERTHYDATQLGNAARKDSSFSRTYQGLFPSLFITFPEGRHGSFRLSASRRIDRPAFQKLNPFLFIINKYTYQQGNPYYRPQYTWNGELSHLFRNWLVTTVSYSHTTDYFSQIFTADANGVVIYTEGNLGRAHNLGLSASVQLAPAGWWSLSGSATVNRKKIEGMVWRNYSASITQGSLNLNNQFRFKKGWSAELSGFYNTRSQADLQEIVDPAGQLSVGFGKTVLQNRGTLRLTVRDLFYTQWMKGWTYFEHATEYFKLTRDTRVATLSFTYRFGKATKAARRSEGSAREEIERVGNG